MKKLYFLFTLLITQFAHASDCSYSVIAQNVTISWDQNFQFQAVNLTVSKTSLDACTANVTFSKGGSSDYNRSMKNGSTNLYYQLYKDSSFSSVLKDGPDVAGSSDYFSLNFASGANQNQTVTYYVVIPQYLATTPTYKPSGNYVDDVAIHVYDSSSMATPLASTSVAISAYVPKILDLSLVPAGGAFVSNQVSQTLNFGQLDHPQTQSVDLLIRTNAGYAATFTSQNGGVLKNAAVSENNTIPYSLSVNSMPVNLSNGPALGASGSGQTSTAGALNRLTITTSEPNGVYAGQYSDYISITAQTIE